MTIAALLRHHGINVPRWVTVDGQIIFDDVTTSSSTSIHPTYGAVTPVSNHTFHGGEDEPTDDASNSPWWENDDQLTRHRSAMESAFPTWSYVPASDDRGPSWVGPLDTGRGKFWVAIWTRHDQGLPRVAVLGPKLGVNAGRRWIPAPHLYLNGSLCVASTDDWQPAEHTVATVVTWAAHWLAAYTEWRMTRRWPVEGTLSLAA